MKKVLVSILEEGAVHSCGLEWVRLQSFSGRGDANTKRVEKCKIQRIWAAKGEKASLGASEVRMRLDLTRYCDAEGYILPLQRHCMIDITSNSLRQIWATSGE